MLRRLRRRARLSDPFSSLGPATGTLAVSTGSSIAAYYNRKRIMLTIDPAAGTSIVYCLLGAGTPSATNFHFALGASLPPVELEYTGAIQLVASSSTIHVGVVDR